jgi:hypothetical protein
MKPYQLLFFRVEIKNTGTTTLTGFQSPAQEQVLHTGNVPAGAYITEYASASFLVLCPSLARTAYKSGEPARPYPLVDKCQDIVDRQECHNIVDTLNFDL